MNNNNQKKYKNELARSKAIKIANSKDERFELRRGDKSWIYLDHGDVMCNPQQRKAFLAAMESKIKQMYEDFDNLILANVDSKSSPEIKIRLAKRNNEELPIITVINKTVKQAEKGTERRVRLPADLTEGDTILIVDDLTTTGGTAKNTRDKIAQILHDRKDISENSVKFDLLVGTARRPSAAKKLEEQGFRKVEWCITLEDVLRSMKENNHLTDQQISGLNEELDEIELEA